MSNPQFDSLSGNYDARNGLFDNPIINTAFTADPILTASAEANKSVFAQVNIVSADDILTSNPSVEAVDLTETNIVSADDILTSNPSAAPPS